MDKWPGDTGEAIDLARATTRTLKEIRAAFSTPPRLQKWEISDDLTVVELLHLKETLENAVQKQNAKRKKPKKLPARRKNTPKKSRR